MIGKIAEADMVILTQDISKYGFKEGDTGIVVKVFESVNGNNRPAYMLQVYRNGELIGKGTEVVDVLHVKHKDTDATIERLKKEIYAIKEHKTYFKKYLTDGGRAAARIGLIEGCDDLKNRIDAAIARVIAEETINYYDEIEDKLQRLLYPSTYI